jgi:shikimate kinase
MAITLIGMPGVGKSTVGKMLSEKLDYSFIDIDKEIEKRMGAALQDILDSSGDAEFIKIEEKEVLRLGKIERAVISPGGSIIYSPNAMARLRSISRIIFLDATFDTIVRRIGGTPRGIVGLKEKGLRGVYDERKELYVKYADETIDTEGLDVEGIVGKIVEVF